MIGETNAPSSKVRQRNRKLQSIFAFVVGVGIGFLAILVGLGTVFFFVANRLFWNTADGSSLPTPVQVSLSMMTGSAIVLAVSSSLWFGNWKRSALAMLCLGVLGCVASILVPNLLFADPSSW